jgi:hypothetical protein
MKKVLFKGERNRRGKSKMLEISAKQTPPKKLKKI